GPGPSWRITSMMDLALYDDLGDVREALRGVVAGLHQAATLDKRARADLACLLTLVTTGLQDIEPAEQRTALEAVEWLLTHPPFRDGLEDSMAVSALATLLRLLLDHMESILNAHYNARPGMRLKDIRTHAAEAP